MEPRAVVSEFPDPIESEVDDFLSDCVVASGEVVSGILFSRDDLFRMEELAVGASSDLIGDSGFEIQEYGARHVFAGSSLGEESIEGVVSASNCFVRGHLAIGLDAVF